VLEVAQRELLQECDYEHEAVSTTKFKKLLSPYPEFAVPAVVPFLSSKRVLTTEWMPGVPIDRAAKESMSISERDRVGSRLLWLSLHELFSFKFMQTDPNWSNFLYEPRTGQLSLIDFGACQSYDAPFVDEYLRLVRACAEGGDMRASILDHSRRLGFLTGDESELMLDAHVSAASLVGSPFQSASQPFNFGAQEISKRIASDVATMLKHRLTPPREEIYALHRRLNGCFQLAARVGATIPARDILLDVYDNHTWHPERLGGPPSYLAEPMAESEAPLAAAAAPATPGASTSRAVTSAPAGGLGGALC
jgi:aarF domain-containing kinase